MFGNNVFGNQIENNKSLKQRLRQQKAHFLKFIKNIEFEWQ